MSEFWEHKRQDQIIETNRKHKSLFSTFVLFFSFPVDSTSPDVRSKPLQMLSNAADCDRFILEFLRPL